MASRRKTTARVINAASAEQIAAQMREMLPSGMPVFPTPIEAVRRVLIRLEEAWDAACEAPPITRAAAMVKVIETFARYTGVEMAVQMLAAKSEDAAGSWRDRMIQAGWRPPGEDQILPGLPAPQKQTEPSLEGVKVIEVKE